MKNIRTITGTILVVGLALVMMGPSRAEADRAQTRCRARIAATSHRHLTQTMQARQRCIKRIIKGDIPPTVDCISGTGDKKLGARLLLIQSRLDRALPRSCSGIDLVFLDYPGRCVDSTGAPFDVSDVEQCIQSVGDTVITDLLTKEFPPLDRFYRDQRATCLRGVGNRALAMIRDDLRARQACLLRDERLLFRDPVDCRAEIPPYGPGTGDETTDARIRNAYVNLLAGVPIVCATVDVDPLGYSANCPDETGEPFNVFDLKQCLFDQNRAQMAEYLETSFPSAPVCGNGRPEGDEECDNGAANSDDTADACRSDCKLPSCGDGVTDPSVNEECDDGNDVADDGCTACIRDRCGDGIINNAGAEECDDGDANNSDTTPDACRSDCKLPSCGDGVTDSANGEECDDSNTVSEDFCSGTDADSPCHVEFCGDGVLQSGGLLNEGCDDGANNSNIVPDACRTDCTPPSCGDGVVDPSINDQCDDGNQIEGDGCDTNCTPTACGNGVVSPGEECDDGNTSINDGCDENCQIECGNGVLNTGESCDDGANNSDTTPDACRSDCTPPICGDGVIDPSISDECDDGAANSDTTPNACRTNCKLPSCGDGVSDTGAPNSEVCDGADKTACAADENCSGDCSGCTHQCPGFGSLILASGAGGACTTNADCPVGECDQSLQTCRTVTSLDSGWTGLSHNADVNDATLMRAYLECPNAGPVCGQCDVVGIDPSPGNCRCNENIRMVCDQPFEVDSNDCNVGPCGDIGPCEANGKCNGAPALSCTSNADCATRCLNDDKYPGPRECTVDSDCEVTCDCFFGAPFPLSSSGVPACVVNRFADDITGTANVDEGAGSVTADLRTVVYTGSNTTIDPCPKCGGTCSDDPSIYCSADLDCNLGPCRDRFGTMKCLKDDQLVCATNADCNFGGCDMDDVIGDGVRNGVCVGGRYEGMSCDVYAVNTTFPARVDGRGGAGYSLDCIPGPLTNVSGSGLRIALTQSTDQTEMSANVDCGGLVPGLKCTCKMCSADTTVPCNSDADCSAQPSKCHLLNKLECTSNADCASVYAGPCNDKGRCAGSLTVKCTSDAQCNIDAGACDPSTCSSTGGGTTPAPNKCSDGVCVDIGDGRGECNTGPDDGYCDAMLRANGEPFLTCSSNSDCVENSSGVPGGAGNCSIVKRRPCLLDPIVAAGSPDPNFPVGAALFCIPPTSSGGINTVAGLPGPGRARNQGIAATFCRDSPGIQYQPGVGGCP